MKHIILSLFISTSCFSISSTVLGMDSPSIAHGRASSHSTSFTNPELFQFPFLQGWKNIDESQEKDKLEEIETQAKPKTEEGIRAKIQKDFTRANQAFLEASFLGSESAMTQLGHMALAGENYPHAFNWYNLAQHTSFLKTGFYSQGPSATGILNVMKKTPLLSSQEYLLLIDTFNRYDFSMHPLSIRAHFILTQFCEKSILYPSPPLNDNLYWGLARLADDSALWERLECLYAEKRLGQHLNEKERYQHQANCLRRANTPEANYRLGILIGEKRVLHTFDGKPISDQERPLLAAEFYRKANSPKSLFNLAALIHNKVIHFDEDNNPFEEKERDTVAVRCLLKTDMPQSLHLIAGLLREKKIKCNIKGEFIDKDVPESFYSETAAFYYRKANLPYSRLILAELVASKLINTDETGRKIASDYERCSAVVRCLKGLKREDFNGDTERRTFITNLGRYVQQGIITYDEKGKKIRSEKQRGETAAEYFREARTGLAQSNLSELILQKLTDFDELRNAIHTDEERFQAAGRCSSPAHPSSLHNLALITLYDYSHLPDYKERALSYASQAIFFGDESATHLYIQIKKEMEKGSETLEKKETKDLETEANKIPPQGDQEAEEAHPQVAGEEIQSVDRQRIKEIAKKYKNHKAANKKLLEKQISQREFNELLTKDKNRETQADFQVTWSRDAIKQFCSLPSYEAKKIHYLIQLIKEGDTRRGRPETLQGKDSVITRRIDKGDRLAYSLTENGIYIISTKEHVKKK